MVLQARVVDRSEQTRSNSNRRGTTSPSKTPSSKLTEAEQAELILENQEHGYRMAWKLLSQWRVRLGQDEVRSVVGVALCEAALRFDRSFETSFRTFFFYHLRGLLLKEVSSFINSRNLLRLQSETASGSMEEFSRQVSEETPTNLVERRTPERLLQDKELSELCKLACSYLDELEQEIITRYFVEDTSLMAIADELGYCRCHLSRVKNKALLTLKKILAPLGPEGIQRLHTERLNLPSRSEYSGGRGRRRVAADTVKQKAA